MTKGIPCHHSGCAQMSQDRPGNLNHGALHFTASVMGNPEYLNAIKNIKPAPDRRMEGIEKLNSIHAAHHEKRAKKQAVKK